MKRKFFTFLLAAMAGLMISGSAYSQKMIGLNTGLEIPGGELGSYYKLAPSISVFYKSFNDDYSQFAYGLFAGYSSHGPKNAIVTEDGTDYSFGNLSCLTLAGSAEYYILDEEFTPMIGLDLGYNFMSYSITSVNGSGSGLSATEGRAVLGGKIGAMYDLNDNFSLFSELGYNFMLGLDGTNSDGSSNVDLSAPGLKTTTFKVGAAYVF